MFPHLAFFQLLISSHVPVLTNPLIIIFSSSCQFDVQIVTCLDVANMIVYLVATYINPSFVIVSRYVRLRKISTHFKVFHYYFALATLHHFTSLTLFVKLLLIPLCENL